MVDVLRERLEPYGVPASGWIDLTRGPTPSAIRYLDLCRNRTGTEKRPPDAVVEIQNEPIACVVDGCVGGSLDDLPALRRTVAMREDIPYLVVSEPGRLTVYEVDLRKEGFQDDEGRQVRPQDGDAQSTFQRLYLDPWVSRGRRFVHDVLFDLLTEAIDGLLEAGVKRDDAISLAGRALFVRFLVDRGILSSDELDVVCPGVGVVEDLFLDARFTKATCSWLDRTFNGDFLPISTDGRTSPISEIARGSFHHLSNILHKSPGGQLRFDWGDLDFAHIPVGVLSQVYEKQAERWDAAGQRTQSVYYTPWRIAEYMVRGVFAGLEERGPVPPHQARILDPSVGGGVFLVAAFQEIVAAHWRHQGEPPDTKQIRQVLTQQLAGFDISEPALRLTALGLYLKAIELDPDPQPVEKLRFSPLRGVVLHNMRGAPQDSGERFALGSLGPQGGGEHLGTYDVVVGNPPWTSLRGNDGRDVHAAMVDAIRHLADERLGPERAATFTIPDLVPDLPFVWRAMEWCRPGGFIAFALHGRLLFKTSTKGTAARNDLFSALTVTGILNGTDLRKTEVWPQISAPFCLLFAMNEPLQEGQSFYFASPYLDRSVNRQGRMRIDSLAAQPISPTRITESPSLLKSLFRGSGLDFAVLQKIQERRNRSVKAYWGTFELSSSQGYRIANKSEDATFLIGKPNLTSSSPVKFLIDCSKLSSFVEPKLERPRSPEIYLGPLLLVRKSPPSDRSRGRAAVCLDDIAFCESFYGFSASNHPNGSLLVRYLFLILHSKFFLWYLLMASGEFGVEREAIQKDDIESLPFPPLEQVTGTSLAEVHRLFDAVVSEVPGAFDEVDQWCHEIYGLDRWDQETIHDTLEVSLPYPASQKRAQARPTREEILTFAERLQQGLLPFVGEQLSVVALPSTEGNPWQAILVSTGSAETLPAANWTSVLDLADKHGASEIVAPLDDGRLVIAILRQYRYWTPSRARLCVLGILEDFLSHLVHQK